MYKKHFSTLFVWNTVAVRAKHKGGTRANSDDCIMKVKKNFPRFARTDRRYVPLCTAFRSASPNTKLLPTAVHSITTPPSTFLDPPLKGMD